MRLLHEPLFHFLLLGAGVFVISLFTGRGTPPPTDRQIIVSQQEQSLLKNGFILDNGHDPTAHEMQRLIDSYVREEVLVREARAQGLDRDDSIVRRRLVQKMEFAAPEPAAPSDAQLQDYLAEHPSAFRASDGKTAELAQIQKAVLAAWMNDQRKQAADALYETYKKQYQVSIDAATTTSGAKP